MRIEKLGKVRFYFVTGCFIKPFKVIIDQFFYSRFFCSQDIYFHIRITQEISKRQIGNEKLLGMANYKIYFKSHFNLLVMNVTQIKKFEVCSS